MFQNVIDVISIIIALAPIGVKVFSLLTAKTHNQRLKNLAERAEIIVTGLERADMSNEQKHDAAMLKLAKYAKEVGIPVTGDQLDDYIESAVTFIRVLTSTEK